MADQRIFRILFLNRSDLYEVYAESVTQGGIFGFIEIEGLLFGKRSDVVIDPSEERLKTEFDSVERFHVPMHAVVRIDEVAKKGVARITEGDPETDNVSPFPMPIYRPEKGPDS